VTRVYQYNYHSSGHCPLSCLVLSCHVFKNKMGQWIVSRIVIVATAVHSFQDWCCHLVKKLTLGLPSTITLEIVPFHTHGPFPALVSFLKCILEIMFSESVQYRLRFCLDHLNCVKMAVSSIREAKKGCQGPSQASRMRGGGSFW
jgi:hypothetical protein